MGKLTAKQRETVGKSVSSVALMPNKCNVQIVTSHTKIGETVKGVLSSVYPEYGYVAADNFFVGLLGSNILQDWTRFRVLTNNREKAKDMLEEISSCIEEYGNAQQEVLSGVDPGIDPLDEDDNTSATDWTTYIILGVAAVAIIALLIPWKK